MFIHSALQTRRRDFLFLAGALMSLRAFARTQPFWNTRPASEWSESEIETLITNSPWARPFSTSISKTVDNSGAAPPPVPRNPGGGWSIPGGGRIGGLGLPGTRTPDRSRGTVRIPVEGVVRWESARPILEALRTPLPGDFDKCVVLSVSGLPQAPEQGERRGSDYDAVRGAARLEHNQTAQAPGLVQDCPTATGATRTLLFGFDRDKLRLSEASGMVVFSARIAAVEVKARFKMSDMTYRGEFTA